MTYNNLLPVPTLEVVKTVAVSAIAHNGTLTVVFPNSHTSLNYAKTGFAIDVPALQGSFADSDATNGITTSISSSQVVITYKGATTIPAGSDIKVTLPNITPGGLAGADVLAAINPGGTTVLAALTDSTGGVASSTLAAATNTDALTDSSGGTPSTTIAAIGASYVQATMANAIATLAAELAKQRTLNTVLINAVASLAAKVNSIQATELAEGVITAS